MKRFKIRVKVFFVAFLVAWWVTGLLLIPVVQDRMFNRRDWWPGTPSPQFLSTDGYIFLGIVLAFVAGGLFLGKAKELFDRFIASLCLVFNQFPALAYFLESGLYVMIVPVGFFALLSSPVNPLVFLRIPFPWSASLRDFLSYAFKLHVPISLETYVLGFLLFPIGFPVGLGLFTVALIQLLRGRGRLVTSGLYRVVRHPQYLGIVLATFGFLSLNLFETKLISWMTWVIMVFAYVWLARREEAGLQENYGEEFLAYKRKVSFMLPLPKRRREQPKPKS